MKTRIDYLVCFKMKHAKEWMYQTTCTSKKDAVDTMNRLDEERKSIFKRTISFKRITK